MLLSPKLNSFVLIVFLACSGMLNGVFREGANKIRHIAHRVKYLDQFTEEAEEAGELIIRNLQFFSYGLTLGHADHRRVPRDPTVGLDLIL